MSRWILCQRKESLREKHQQERLQRLTETRKECQQRISNMWKRIDLYYDGDDYRSRIKVYPDEKIENTTTKYYLWIIYDKENCFSRCGTTDGSFSSVEKVLAHGLWQEERYYVFYECFQEKQAKTIKQIIKNVVSNAGFNAGFGRAFPLK